MALFKMHIIPMSIAIKHSYINTKTLFLIAEDCGLHFNCHGVPGSVTHRGPVLHGERRAPTLQTPVTRDCNPTLF